MKPPLAGAQGSETETEPRPKEGGSASTRRDTLRRILGIGVTLAAPLKTLGAANAYRSILIPEGGHPALRSAAAIIGHKLGIAETEIRVVPPDSVPQHGQIALAVNPTGPRQQRWLASQPASVKFDGYLIGFRDGGALIRGNRPRSLLYAAGDVNLWMRQTTGTYLREPAFELRVSHGSRGKSMAEAVAFTGANLMQGDPAVATLKSSFPNVFQLLSSNDREHLLQVQAKTAERSKRRSIRLVACRRENVTSERPIGILWSLRLRL